MAEVKKRRRKHKTKKMPHSLKVWLLATLAVVIFAAAGIMITPAFNITEVYSEGCNNLKTEDVISAAQIENGTHILIANIGGARRRVEENPLVKEAKIRRVFPNKICITVTERIPAGYVMRGAECNVIDSEGIVLEVINDSRANLIVKEFTPEPVAERKSAEDENKKDGEEKSEDEKSKDEDKKETESKQKEEEKSESGDDVNTEEVTMPYSIPLVAGFECEATDARDKLKATDKERYDKSLAVLNALRNAGILERTTYVDVTDLSDIRIVVENRLDVYLGRGDNIDYRAKFLAEVIETKISAHEKAVMDYRGDDIFVRAPEDGKDRMYKEKEESSDEEDENSDEKADEEKSDDEKSDKKKKSDKESDDKNNDEEKSGDNSETDDEKESEDDVDSDKKSQTNMSLDE